MDQMVELSEAIAAGALFSGKFFYADVIYNNFHDVHHGEIATREEMK